MILTCPNCKAKYFVKDEIVGISGTDVTCPTCSHKWFQLPDSQTLTPIKPKRADQIYTEQLLAKQKQKIQQGKRFIWGLVALVVFGVLAALYFGRNTIVTYWSETSSVYRMLGIEVNRYGVEWVGLEQKRVFDGTRPIVKITGVVKNTTATEKRLPLIAIHLKDEQGDIIETRYAEFPYPDLNPSERLRVGFEIENPPSESTEVALVFVDNIPSMGQKIIRIEDVTN